MSKKTKNNINTIEAIFLLEEENKKLKEELQKTKLEIKMLKKREKKLLNVIKFLNKCVQKLNNLAYHDQLTKLANRHALEHALKNENVNFVAMIDVDNFKKFNDTYGHDFGDKILIRMANKLSKIDNVLVERHGGEEFFILFQEKNFQKVINTMEKIRKEIEETLTLPNDDNKKIAYNIDDKMCGTISVGITPVIKKQNKIDDSKTLRHADIATYVAKGTMDKKLIEKIDEANLEIDKSKIGQKNILAYVEMDEGKIKLLNKK